MDDGLLDVARTIRPYLAELVGLRAPFYDAEIARLIAAANAGPNVHDELLQLLERSPAMRAWVTSTLDDELHRPPDLQPSKAIGDKRALGYKSLPGESSPTAADRFCCPEQDFIWWRRSVGIPMSECPTHGGTLVPCAN